MLGSVLLPTQPPGLRRNTYTSGIAPPLPPRRNSLSSAPSAQTAKLLSSLSSSAQTSKVQLKLSTLPSDNKTMDSRYKRSSSPRRYANPARSSTGTFADPYYDYSMYRPSSPRSSAERIGSSHHHSSSAYYTPSTSSGSRASTQSSYGRPRRNTNEAMTRPTTTTTSMPIRTPYTPHSNLDRPSSPLAGSRDKRSDTYITQPTRTSHKKIYSVDDTSRSTQLVAERDTVESPRHRDSVDRGYGVTSGSRTYHNSSKPPARLTDLGDDGYSYTDPASMYRDTEPAWRRPRAGSLERSSRPTSMIMDRAPRSSTRELGPPPSVRGFDKINNSIPRPHGRSSSIDRSREIPKYDPYPDTAAPSRTSSTRHHAPAVHQEPRDHRRDTYHDTYDRRDRDIENRRHNTVDHLPDPQVASRGFGIAPSNPALAHDHHTLDRQPIRNAPEPAHARADDYGAPYHSSHRASTHMPDPRASDSRVHRGRDSTAPPAAYDNYEKRPREREGSAGFVPVVAGAATGVAAGIGAANYMKNREKDREERNSSEERERERDRERRRVQDERDSRDKDDRRDEKRERRSDERRDVAPPAPANAPPPEADRKPRERRYEDDERNHSRKAPSSEGSGDERPRHYVDRDAERRRDAAPKEPAVDPDEEYRRRIQQEAERSGRSGRDRDHDDTDRERRRRRDDRDSSRSPDERSRASPPSSRDGPSSRPDERSNSVYDASLVQEPESFDKLQADQPNKSVTIVTPPKEPQPAVKGILRKPTEKFPEEPEPIREGVAPHKDALKGKDIPIGARWTRIDRRLVNPQALEEAKERFEERMDCVIVLRVLTKQEIQKLADRTKKIRERRGKFTVFPES
jgi:hypothetical protein